MEPELLKILLELSSKIDTTQKILEKRIEENRIQTMKEVATLMDTQFTTQFNLLSERFEQVMEKAPTQEDIDIIDGTLEEHTSELKMVRRDVNELKDDVSELKKAQ